MRNLLMLGIVLVALIGALFWKLRDDGSEGEGPPEFETSSNSTVLTLGVGEGEGAGMPAYGETSSAEPGDASGKPGATRPADAGYQPGDSVRPSRSTPPGQEEVRGEEARTDPDEPGNEPGTGGQPAEGPQQPAEEPKELRYVVRSGDGLWSILTRAYGGASQDLVQAVAEANGLEDAGALEIGQELVLPVVPDWPAPELPDRD